MPERHIHLRNLRWKVLRERILMFSGIGLIAAEFVVSEFLDRPYHVEYLLVGLAMCGIPITTQWISSHNETSKDA